MSLSDDQRCIPGEWQGSSGAALSYRSRTERGFGWVSPFALLCGVCLLLVGWCAAGASAAVTHEYEPVPSEALSAGVPSACGKAGCVPGPFGHIESLAVAGGGVWVADGEKRIDGFEGASPWGVSPQLDPEGGAGSIGSSLAVGGVGGEELVYTTAYQAGQEVVAVYGAGSGELLGTWTGAHTLNKSFTRLAGSQAGALGGIAVDRSGNLLTKGDVYVESRGNTGEGAFNVVSVFKEPSGVTGEEPELVATLKGTCATTGVSCGGDPVPFVEPTGVAVSPANGDVLVDDASPTGQVVDVFAPSAMHEYVFVGQIVGPPSGHFHAITGLAVDSMTGDIYVADRTPISSVVYQFSGDGGFEYLGHLTGPGSSDFHEVRGVGVLPGSGQVVVAEDNPEVERSHEGAIDVFGPGLVVPNVETGAAAPVVDGEGHIGETLSGTVDPLEQGEAKCWFAWGESEAFGEPDAKCEPEAVPNKNENETAKATIEGLQPDTSYSYRLQASNHNGENPGEPWQDGKLHTPGPGIHGEFVSEASATSVTLGAEIDPNDAPTNVYFQYSGTGSTSGCPLTPETSGEGCSASPEQTLAPAGGSDDEVQAHVQGLVASHPYHYRVLVVSDLQVNGVQTPVVFAGPDRVFGTQPVGSGAALPDGRAWELVSPTDKHGATLFHPGQTGTLQAAVSGDAFTYTLTRPTEADVSGFTQDVQAISTRAAAGGWSTHDMPIPHESAAGGRAGGGVEFRLFSPDLSLGVVEPVGSFTSLSPEVFPPDTEQTPYVRHDQTCASEPGSCYVPIATGAEGFADVPPGTVFGGRQETAKNPRDPVGQVNFRGGSPDLKHIIVASGVQLTHTVTPKGVVELYEWSAEKPPTERFELVSIEEGEQPASENAGLGYESNGETGNARGAVSGDGTTVFWTKGPRAQGGLFMRDLAKGTSVRLDAIQGGTGAGRVAPVFQGASYNGSRVFFTDEQALTADAGAAVGQPDLYVCEITEHAGALGCALTDLTPRNGKEDGGVQRTMPGFSEDGSWAYFIANGVLPGTEAEGAKPGSCVRSESLPGATCNLYVEHYDGHGWEQPRLVAVLSGDDFADWAGTSEAELSNLLAGVSSSGRWLAFLSDRELTGYDNHDASSGRPDEEVFVYHASVGAPGTLACASCNPTGARPDGVEWAQAQNVLYIGANRSSFKADQWFAATVPGYTEYELTKGLYRPRYLSNEGRLFFDSSDALVPQDVNGTQSVYEYEPAGVGGAAGCTASRTTYVPDAYGCVALVSSGSAAGEAVFLDASETGDDVFFETFGRLTGQDIDNAVDVYDAHVCSGASPCRVESPVPPACTTADACRAAPSVEPEVFGVPGSSALSGSGNLVSVGVVSPVVKKVVEKSVKCKKDFVKNGKGKCVKARKRARRAKRAGHDGRAKS